MVTQQQTSTLQLTPRRWQQVPVLPWHIKVCTVSAAIPSAYECRRFPHSCGVRGFEVLSSGRRAIVRRAGPTDVPSYVNDLMQFQAQNPSLHAGRSLKHA